MKTTLQVPVSIALKETSSEVAKEYGFSSLQEAVRVFLAQLANRELKLGFVSSAPDEVLTSNEEEVLSKKYLKVKKEIENKEGFIADSAEELLRHLRSA